MPDTAANYRMLHTMIRVNDLDKSLDFYTAPLGMKLLRKQRRTRRQVHAWPSSATATRASTRSSS